MKRVSFFLTLSLCLCFQLTKAQQFTFDVKDQFTNLQFKVTINTSSKLITAKGTDGSSFNHQYYKSEVAEGIIGFAMSQGTTPLFKIDDSKLCFIINSNDIRYFNPSTKNAYKFNPINFSNFTYTYNSLLADVKGGKKEMSGNNVISNNISRKPSIKTNQTFKVNGVSFKMVYVQGGTFQMGSNEGAKNEKPVHSVTLSDYHIGETEVTQKLWEAVMGDNPSSFEGGNRPVTNVSWEKCQVFISRLNRMTGQQFRLPTEAEWEFAARGGNKSHGYKYSGSSNLDDVAWYWKNSGDKHLSESGITWEKLVDNNNKTHKVATKSPNELGIYDMSGNVSEYCSDIYGNYNGGNQTNPVGPSNGYSYVVRGGDFLGTNGVYSCRVVERHSTGAGDTGPDSGFRLAL